MVNLTLVWKKPAISHLNHQLRTMSIMRAVAGIAQMIKLFPLAVALLLSSCIQTRCDYARKLHKYLPTDIQGCQTESCVDWVLMRVQLADKKCEESK
jgi:hypothetical protein